ncbi:MAG: hypothetical protein OIF51_12360 [Cellvibrionaceae bacterium]|nr:hypothetical protein [Cellvibrionaceae bacterium]
MFAIVQPVFVIEQYSMNAFEQSVPASPSNSNKNNNLQIGIGFAIPLGNDIHHGQARYTDD